MGGLTHEKFPERAQVLQRLRVGKSPGTVGGAQHKLCEGNRLPFAWAEAGRKQQRGRRAGVRMTCFANMCPAPYIQFPKGAVVLHVTTLNSVEM